MKKLQLVVPTAVAMIVALAALQVGGFEPGRAGYTVESAPTPYSNDHALVQSRPGAAEEQPATF